MNGNVCVARGLRQWLSAAGMVLLLVTGALALSAAGSRRALGATVQPLQAVVQAETAAAPVVINFQGRLLEPANGLPKSDGSYNMKFALYNEAGALQHEESRAVTVTRGTFSTNIGDAAVPLPLGIFNGQPLFLGITVGADPEMAPRIRIAHSPYAIYATKAANANVAALANSVADDSVTSNKIADGEVGTADIANKAVTGDKILDESVSPLDMNVAGTSAGQVLATNGAVAGWATLPTDGLIGYTVLAVTTRSLNPTPLLPTMAQVGANIGTFEKRDASSTILVYFSGRPFISSIVAGGTGANFEIRVDSLRPASSRAAISLRTADVSSAGLPASSLGVFTGLGVGTHTVSLWAGSWYATANVGVDNGNFGADHIVVIELK